MQNSREKSHRRSDFSLDRGFTFYQIKPYKNSSNSVSILLSLVSAVKNFKIAITLNKLSLGINSILITGIISTITSSVLSHEFGSILLPLLLQRLDFRNIQFCITNLS